ncbi:MAG: hypothetical protein Q8R44_19795 [Novosphingobium sp.]|nr:hypothetical protein [Novosphingobium sp.]
MRMVAPFALTLGTIIGEATGGSSDNLAIPNDASGNKAKRIWVNVTSAAYILPTTASGSVTSTTGMVLSPGDGGIILEVASSTFVSIAHLQVAAAGRISIASVEN